MVEIYLGHEREAWHFLNITCYRQPFYVLQKSAPTTLNWSWLLKADCVETLPDAYSQDLAYLYPPLGCQSAWSAHVQELLEQCGISDISIERGWILTWSQAAETIIQEASQTIAGYAWYKEIMSRLTQKIPRVSLPVLPPLVDEAAMMRWVQAKGWKVEPVAISAWLSFLEKNPTFARAMCWLEGYEHNQSQRMLQAHWVIDGKGRERSVLGWMCHTLDKATQAPIRVYRESSVVWPRGFAYRWWHDPEGHVYNEHYEAIASVASLGIAVCQASRAITQETMRIVQQSLTLGRGAVVTALWSVWSGWSPHRVHDVLTFQRFSRYQHALGLPHVLAVYDHTMEIPVVTLGVLGQMRPKDARSIRILPGMHVLLLGALESQEESVMLPQEVSPSDPDRQRRLQTFIENCWALGVDNPLLCMRLVGAENLTYACAEFLLRHHVGMRWSVTGDVYELGYRLRTSNQACLLAIIQPQHQSFVEELCRSARMPIRYLGTTLEEVVFVHPGLVEETVPLKALLYTSAPTWSVERVPLRRSKQETLACSQKDLYQALLQHPDICDKSHWLTQWDRSVGGQVVSEAIVGPYQVAVGQSACVMLSYADYAAEAIAVGLRRVLSMRDPSLAAILALIDALLKIGAYPGCDLSTIRVLTAWQVPEIPQATFYDAAKALAKYVSALEVPIVVAEAVSVAASYPCACITALGSLQDARAYLTPVLIQQETARLWLIDLSQETLSLSGTLAAQINQRDDELPTYPSVDIIKRWFTVLPILHAERVLSAYHVRTLGGTLIALTEMAFASQVGLDIFVPLEAQTDPERWLYHEGPGIIVQVLPEQENHFRSFLERYRLQDRSSPIARLTQSGNHIRVYNGESVWMEVSFPWAYEQWSVHHGQNSSSSYKDLKKANHDGSQHPSPLYVQANFDVQLNLGRSHRPRIAILREQGSHGHHDLAAAFTQAGGEAADLTLEDLLSGRVSLDDYRVLAVSGGCSFGDVLGAGFAWSYVIQQHPTLKSMFQTFFHHPDTVTLGIGNGAQMLLHLKSLMPGTEAWPNLNPNASEQFESRFVMVEVNNTHSLAFRGMEGAQLPVPVAHYEGRVQSEVSVESVTLRYIDPHGCPTQYYPFNPNGSDSAIAGWTNKDGRINLMMVQPERIFRSTQWPLRHTMKRYTPWIKLFDNLLK